MVEISKPLPKFYKDWPSNPSVIILHFTFGYTAQQAWDVLKSRGLSAHKIIERDGAVWTCVEDENRGIHAGYGRWNGLANMNHHSLGIEMVNFGYGEGELPDDGKYYFDYDKKYPNDPEVNVGKTLWYRTESGSSGNPVRIATRQSMDKFPDHRDEWKDKFWSIYPDEQLETTFEVVWRWVKKFNILPENVIGHEHVTPHRKTDPGPSFPWHKLEDYLEGRMSRELPDFLRPEFRMPSRIKAVQSHLDRLGYNVGVVDGIWGNRTKSCLQRALDDFGPTYRFGYTIDPENCYAIASCLRRIPGFDPGRS